MFLRCLCTEHPCQGGIAATSTCPPAGLEVGLRPSAHSRVCAGEHPSTMPTTQQVFNTQ